MFSGDPIRICNTLYQNADKDTVYYGMLASKLNKQFC